MARRQRKRNMEQQSTLESNDQVAVAEKLVTTTRRTTRFQLRNQSTIMDNNEGIVEMVEEVKPSRRKQRRGKEHPPVSQTSEVDEDKSEDVSSSPRSLQRQTTFTKDEVVEGKMKNNNNNSSTPATLKRQSTFTKDEQVAEEKSESAKSTPVTLQRQSTFTKDNSEVEVKKNDTPPVIKRESTFIKDNEDTMDKAVPVDSTSAPIKRRSSLKNTGSEKGTERKSLCASPAPKLGKSIGSRIMSSLLKSATKPSAASSVKKTIGKHTTPGLSVKKTMKNMATPGSEYRNRYGVARKLPDFKAAHQRLFGNMESIADNEKRKAERAQGLLQSPIVPRCATLSSNKKVPPPKENLDTKVPLQKENLNANVKTATPTNRFGFKPRIKKEEARSLVKTKLPPRNTENIKDTSRSMIKGVRMNRRFLLQMEMREKNNVNDK